MRHMLDKRLVGSSSKSFQHWRELSRPALAGYIDQIRRRAGAGEHLSESAWRELDRMRRRLASLQEVEAR